jgi:tetratricopeptide (TPR) repeat protein
VRHWRWLAVAALGALLCGGGPAGAAEKKKTRLEPSFGVLRTPKVEEARAQALQWLRSTGKADAAAVGAFDKIWGSERPVADKVAATLALGDPEVKDLLEAARDPETPAPTAVPALIRDAKRPAFYRANLALAYARALAGRRVYEEALEALKAVRAEDTVDPAAYLFNRAVAEHALLQKEQAEETVDRLLLDVPDVPERYRTVATLMNLDMLAWRDKDLGWISRKMGVIKDRLDIARGGKKTQKMQKEVVVRLDEMIKEMENRAKSGGS